MTGFLGTKLYSSTLPILLRNPETEDASILASILSNPANNEFDSKATSITPAVAENVINRMRASASETILTRVNLVVVLLSAPGAKGEGTVIGLSGFGGIDTIDGKRFADVGVMLNPEYRGRGFATESIRLSVNFAFEGLKADAVSSQTLEKNVAMKNLIDRKFGWKGIKQEARDGSEIRYEVWPTEWAESGKGISIS